MSRPFSFSCHTFLHVFYFFLHLSLRVLMAGKGSSLSYLNKRGIKGPVVCVHAQCPRAGSGSLLLL